MAAWALPVAAADPTALVLGGGGHLGSEIAKRLIARGFEVAVLARPGSDRRRLEGLAVRVIEGDATDSSDVVRALTEAHADVVIDAMAPRSGRPNPFVAAHTHIAAHAKSAGVRQVIFNSSAGAGADVREADYPDINFARFRAALAEKTRAEQIVMTSGVPFTVIRSGAILVERDTAPHPPTARGYLTEDQKVVGPTTYGDLGVLVADCALAPGCMGKVFHASDASLAAEFKRWRCMRFRASPTDSCD